MNPSRKHFLTVAAPSFFVTIVVGLASLKALCLGGWFIPFGVVGSILTLVSLLMLHMMDEINQSE